MQSIHKGPLDFDYHLVVVGVVGVAHHKKDHYKLIHLRWRNQTVHRHAAPLYNSPIVVVEVVEGVHGDQWKWVGVVEDRRGFPEMVGLLLVVGFADLRERMLRNLIFPERQNSLDRDEENVQSLMRKRCAVEGREGAVPHHHQQIYQVVVVV